MMLRWCLTLMFVVRERRQRLVREPPERWGCPTLHPGPAQGEPVLYIIYLPLKNIPDLFYSYNLTKQSYTLSTYYGWRR
jgi:hypothetical protein